MRVVKRRNREEVDRERSVISEGWWTKLKTALGIESRAVYSKVKCTRV